MNTKLFAGMLLFVALSTLCVAQSTTTSAASPSTSTQGTGAIPQPTLVTPSAPTTDGLNGLNQNFNNVPNLNPQFGTSFAIPQPTVVTPTAQAPDGLNQNFNNIQSPNADAVVDQVNPQTNRVDLFGNPLLANGVAIMPSGVPVVVTNPLGNPFNTGITVLPVANLDAGLANPNLPLNVSGFQSAGLQSATFFDTGVQSPGVQFPAITLGTTSVTAVGTSRTNGTSQRGTNVQGITQRSDGTFTNVNN